MHSWKTHLRVFSLAVATVLGLLWTGAALGAPTITQQPQAENVCEGDTAMFTVAATGTGTLTYQWQKDMVNLVDGGDISGATTTDLDIANAEAADAGNYRCVVTDDNGTTNSDEAALTIQADSTADAGADQSICETDTVQLAGAATNAASTLWTTGGDGTFDDAGLLNAVYTPGAGDIAAGMVSLTLTANAIGPCSGSVQDTVDVAIHSNAATADAGPNDRVPEGGRTQETGEAGGGGVTALAAQETATTDKGQSITGWRKAYTSGWPCCAQ